MCILLDEEKDSSLASEYGDDGGDDETEDEQVRPVQLTRQWPRTQAWAACAKKHLCMRGRIKSCVHSDGGGGEGGGGGEDHFPVDGVKAEVDARRRLRRQMKAELAEDEGLFAGRPTENNLTSSSSAGWPNWPRRLRPPCSCCWPAPTGLVVLGDSST